VSDPFEFDEVNVKSIPLPAQGENPADGANATVIGWGTVDVSVKRAYLSRIKHISIVKCNLSLRKPVKTQKGNVHPKTGHAGPEVGVP
jgi:hypothetical protein